MADVLTAEEMDARFEAAKQRCWNGHDAGCSYGGFSPPYGYWLVTEGCTENHSDRCDICGGPAEAGFTGLFEEDWMKLYAVIMCHPCEARWLAAHPSWQRREMEPSDG